MSELSSPEARWCVRAHCCAIFPCYLGGEIEMMWMMMALQKLGSEATSQHQAAICHFAVTHVNCYIHQTVLIPETMTLFIRFENLVLLSCS